MVAHFTIDFDDLMLLQVNMIKNQRRHKIFKWSGTLLGFFMAFILCLIMGGDVINASVAGVIVLLFAPSLYNVITLQKYKKALNKISSSMTGNYKLTISEEDIYIEKGKISNRHSWDKIEKVSSDDNWYFLYLSEKKAIMINKSPSNMNNEEVIEYNLLINNLLSKF